MAKIAAQTARCVVRALEPGDYDAFIAGYRDCRPAVNRFDEGRVDTSALTRAWYRGLLDRRRREAEEDFCYMFNIFLREDGRSIGYCDITPQFRGELQYAKIGYTIFNTHWNSGYATEAVKALTDIGFEKLGLHRLEAHINIDNPASKAVVRKCGYQFECVRKAFILENGVWTDNEIYFLNNENWRPGPETP